MEKKRKKKKESLMHTLNLGLYPVCVSPWRLCLGGVFTPQGMNGSEAETDKREKRASLGAESETVDLHFLAGTVKTRTHE